MSNNTDYRQTEEIRRETPLETDAKNSPQLAKLLEENAELITRFEQENELLSAMIAGTAAAMDETSDEGKEQIISDTAQMFESARIDYDMSPKLFRVFIESCLKRRKFLMPVLAFAYLQQDKTKWEKLAQDTEFVNEYADWMTRKMFPVAEILMNEPAQKSAAPSEKEANETTDDDKNSTVDSETSTASFDELSRKAFATNAPEDLNALFGATYALENWLFIARGEMPNINPYIAANAAIANGQQMIRAFTDGTRLQRFARENNLTREDGSCDILSVPTGGIIEYLEQFIPYGVHGIWFNSDSQSEGFFIPLQQLRPIKEHLAKSNRQENAETKTLIVQIKDGLGFPSGFVKASDETLHIFCRVPSDWVEGEQLKVENLEKIYAQFYGANWRMGNSDGSNYVVLDSYTKIFPPETVKTTKFSGTVNQDKHQFFFYIADRSGAIRKVTDEEFQKDVDAEIQAAEKDAARARQDNLSNFGMSETADGDFDLNLNINQRGAVHFDTLIAPFYEAIVPLLKDYQGSGEYLTLLAFDANGKSEQVENIAENAHGAYLQIRRFLYLNPKNNARIGVNSIHSNSLRHVQSNSKLLVSFELCKNLDNQTAFLYYCFEGVRSEVSKLIAVIEPLLENCGYEDVSQ